MARRADNEKNLNILKEIYDEQSPDKQGKPAKFPEKFKNYFKDSHKVERLLSVTILGFGLVAILLGFFQFKDTINSYFVRDNTGSQEVSLEDQRTEDEDLLGLRAKDTDQDGLSDYDELNIYVTSPYLDDTDSDGISDRDELINGTNPICPEGDDCFLGVENEFSVTADDILLTSKFGFTGLRDALLDAGVSPEILDELSDEELLRAYQQVLIDSQIENSNPSGSIITATDPSELTPDELRILLLQAGVSQNTLNLVSDEDLLELVQEISSPNQPTEE